MRDKHLHLSGATSPIVLWEIVCESGFKTKARSFWEFEKNLTMNRDEIRNLADYLEILHVIDKVQSSPRAVEISVYDAYKSAALAGCTRLELRFNPTKRSLDGVIDLDKIIIAARSGMERARSNFGISGDLILCLGRDCTRAANEAVLQKALQYRGRGVIGIDLAGQEKIPLDDYLIEMFLEAKRGGLETTIHTGEILISTTLSEMRTIMTDIKPDRIGHGIQITKFPELLEHYYPQLEFEICMTSNVTSKAVYGYTEFVDIFNFFVDNKIQFSINTDATYAIGTDIRKEHQHLKSVIAMAESEGIDLRILSMERVG